MSSREGDGSPEGWLCTMMMAAQCWRIGSLNSSPMRTIELFRLPLYTSWLPTTWFLVFSSRVRRCSCSSRDISVSYTHLRAHETRHDLVCRLLLEKKKKKKNKIYLHIRKYQNNANIKTTNEQP